MAFLHHMPLWYPQQTLLIKHCLLRLSNWGQALLMENRLLRLATLGCHTRCVLFPVLSWNLSPWWEYLQSMKLTNVETDVLLLSSRAKQRHSRPSSGLTRLCSSLPSVTRGQFQIQGLNFLFQAYLHFTPPRPTQSSRCTVTSELFLKYFLYVPSPGPLLKLSVLAGSPSLHPPVSLASPAK